MNKNKSSKSQKSWLELREERTNVAAGKKKERKKRKHLRNLSVLLHLGRTRRAAESRGGGLEGPWHQTHPIYQHHLCPYKCFQLSITLPLRRQLETITLITTFASWKAPAILDLLTVPQEPNPHASTVLIHMEKSYLYSYWCVFQSGYKRVSQLNNDPA